MMILSSILNFTYVVTVARVFSVYWECLTWLLLSATATYICSNRNAFSYLWDHLFLSWKQLFFSLWQRRILYAVNETHAATEVGSIRIKILQQVKALKIYWFLGSRTWLIPWLPDSWTQGCYDLRFLLTGLKCLSFLPLIACPGGNSAWSQTVPPGPFWHRAREDGSTPSDNSLHFSNVTPSMTCERGAGS